jgi:hypothetical protein
MNCSKLFRIISKCLILVTILTLMPNISRAAHVRFDLPTNPPPCPESTINSLLGSTRMMAVIDKGFWNRWGLFFDIEKQCTVKISVPPGTQFAGDYHTPFVQREMAFLAKNEKPGAVYKVTATLIERDPYFTDLAPLIANESKYEDYKKATTAAAEEAKEEARQNSIKVLNPKYEKEDAVLQLSYDGLTLKITNKSHEFVTVSAVSTYYENKINTLSGLDLDLPPESSDSKTVTYFKMFTDEMRRLSWVKMRDIPTTHGELRFGFAVKYLINGTPKNYYFVQEYNKQELLAATK